MKKSLVFSVAPHLKWRVVSFALAFVLLNLSAAVCQTSSKIPSCPSGSQSVQWNSDGHRVFSCKFSGRIENNMEQCAEWEGTYWSRSVTVPCGSRVSNVVEQTAYEQQLGCSADRQIYLLNSSTKKLDALKSCLPAGWEIIAPPGGGGCPAGYQSAFVRPNDICVGPRPSSRPTQTPPYVRDCPAGTKQRTPSMGANGRQQFMAECWGQPIAEEKCAAGLQYFAPPYSKGYCRAWLDTCPSGFTGVWVGGGYHHGILSCTAS